MTKKLLINLLVINILYFGDSNMRFTLQPVKGKEVSISKSMAKCKINIDTDLTDYTDFHDRY